MVKSLISMLAVISLLFVGAFFENKYVSNQFEDFHHKLSTLYQKVDEHTALQEDVYAIQDNWLEKKKHLHVFIPHNEIKEFDLWLSETVTLVRDKEWTDAVSKVEVLKELCEQIPKTFILTWENVL